LFFARRTASSSPFGFVKPDASAPPSGDQGERACDYLPRAARAEIEVTEVVPEE
jgi:hypothetical protein